MDTIQFFLLPLLEDTTIDVSSNTATSLSINGNMEDGDGSKILSQESRTNSDTNFKLSEQDIELILATRHAAEKPLTDGYRLMVCNELSDAPHPCQIKDIYSSCLGDSFHYHQRPIVPVHHDCKKSYYVALINAWFDWNKEKLQVLKDSMKSIDSYCDDEIETMIYYCSGIFTSYFYSLLVCESCLCYVWSYERWKE